MAAVSSAVPRRADQLRPSQVLSVTAAHAARTRTSVGSSHHAGSYSACLAPGNGIPVVIQVDQDPRETR